LVLLRRVEETERAASEARAKLLHALAAGVGVTETTYTCESLPPGFRSPESFAGECRRLRLDPETYKPAGSRGWAVPASVWARARHDDKERRRRDRAPVPATGDPIDAALERSGLRLVRRPK
jgi:hypothetical protein